MLETSIYNLAALVDQSTQQAAIMLENTDYQQALVSYSEAIFFSDGRDAKLFGSRAMAYIELEQFDNAIADFDRAIELSSYNPVFYYNRAAVLLAQKKLFSAMTDCQTAISLDPENKDYVNLAVRLSRLLNLLKQSPQAPITKFINKIDPLSEQSQLREICQSPPLFFNCYELKGGGLFREFYVKNDYSLKFTDVSKKFNTARNDKSVRASQKRSLQQATFFSPATGLTITVPVKPDVKRARRAKIV